MNIFVCVKQVPATNNVQVSEKTGVLRREGARSKMNPYDLFALETALRLRREHGGRVTVATMGPPQAQAVIREAYWMGADDGYVISDRRFGGAGGPQTLGTTLRGILSPSILGMLAGLLVVLLELPVPQFLFSAVTTLKGTTTALAMVFVSCVIRGTDFSQMKLTRDLAVVVLVRLLLFPVFVGVLVAALPIDSLTKQVYFVFATMPAMTQMGIMARETGSDYEFAAVLITVTTILSMAAIPIYMGLVTHFHLFL